MIIGMAAALMLPGTAFGFHHIHLPATECAADAAGSPSDNNGEAKGALLNHAGLSLPLPPVNTPGDGHGQGGDFCANHVD